MVVDGVTQNRNSNSGLNSVTQNREVGFHLPVSVTIVAILSSRRNVVNVRAGAGREDAELKPTSRS